MLTILKGMDEARKVLPEEVAYFSDIYEAIDQADAVILLTEWNVYRGLDIKQLRQRMRGNAFVDLRNVYEPAAMQQAGFEYACVGRQQMAMERKSRQRSIMRAWYLIYSKPQQERLALENLERQGYPSYLPLIRNRRRRKGRYVSIIEPMFPRYLFVHLSDETDNWGPIRSTIGVANMVRFGMQAARVPDSLIEMMQERDEEGVQTLAPPELKPGDQVRIVEGVMAGYEAIFRRVPVKSAWCCFCNSRRIAPHAYR